MLQRDVALADIEDFESPEPDAGFVRSVQQWGQVVPVILAQGHGKYRVVCGRRRVAAARKAGMEAVRAIVIAEDSQGEAAYVILENLQRSLNAAAEVEAIAFFYKQGWSVEQIAEQFGISKAKVSMRMTIAERLHPGLWHKLRTGKMSARAAWRAASSLSQEAQATLVEQERVTIQDVEDLRRQAMIESLGLESIQVPRPVFTMQTVNGYETLKRERDDLARRVAELEDEVRRLRTGRSYELTALSPQQELEELQQRPYGQLTLKERARMHALAEQIEMKGDRRNE